LSLPADRIEGYIGKMEKEAKAFKEEALKLSWFMRGGLSYEDAMLLSFSEREMINKIVKDNLETTKKSGLPFF
jgi:hypothetical protein